MPDTYHQTIAKLKEDADKAVRTLKAQPEMAALMRIHVAMNTLEDLCELPRTSLSELFGLEAPAAAKQDTTKILPGEFFGKTPLDAAKAYLRKRGKPSLIDEIVFALKEGSCDVPSKDKLRVSLARSTFEIAKLNDDTFGLLDWYPDEKEKRASGMKQRRGSVPTNGQATEDSAAEDVVEGDAK